MHIENLGFATEVEIEVVDTATSAGIAFRPSLDRAKPTGLQWQSHGDVLHVEVRTARGEAWRGSFESGPGGRTGVFATPCPDIICVVLRGLGYWVPTLRPRTFEVLPVFPVTQVIGLAQPQALVLANHTRLVSYTEAGRSWLTDRLSWDGIRITGVTDEAIHGFAWDSPADREVPFTVRTEAGTVEGGSSPADYGAEPPR